LLNFSIRVSQSLGFGKKVVMHLLSPFLHPKILVWIIVLESYLKKNYVRLLAGWYLGSVIMTVVCQTIVG